MLSVVLQRGMRGVALRALAGALALAALVVGLAAAKPTIKAHHLGAGPAAPAPVTVTTTASVTPRTVSTTPNAQTTTPAKSAKPPAKRPPAPQPLTGLLGGGSLFPARALVLNVPGSAATGLAPGQIHVSEDGSPVAGVTLTQLTHPRAGEFGVVLVIDQSLSMSGAPLAEAMAAARTVAAQRTGNQQLGVVTFDQNPSVALPLTADPKLINAALAASPWVAPGAQVQPALSTAYGMLRRAGIAAGSVILIADGAQLSGNPDAVTDGGLGAGVQTLTIAVRDQSYGGAAKAALQRLDNTKFAESDGVKLGDVVSGAWSTLTHQYLVRYHSRAPHGRLVTVTAQVDHVPGKVTTSYRSPVPPPPPKKAAPPPPQPAPQPVALPAPAPRHSHSFWSSTLAIVLVGGLSALLLAFALALVIAQVRGHDRVQKRIATFIPDPRGERGEEPELIAAPKGPRFLARRDWWPAFVEDVEIGRLERSPAELVKLAAYGSLAAAIGIMLVSGSLALALLGLVIGPVLLKTYVKRAVAKQRRRFAEQLPSHMQDMAGAMRVGRSIVGGITSVAESAAEPIKGELELVLADERLGKPLEEALQDIGRRMHSEDMEQFALIAALHRRSGSNVAEALDRVADGARERADLNRELKALTSQAKISSRVLTGLPIVMFGAIQLLDPAYGRPLIHTVLGIVVMGVSAFLVLIGWLVMKKIVNVDV